MTYEAFIGRFEKRKDTQRGAMVRCPAHEDKQASLSVGRAKDGGVVLKCFAGCETADVVKALGLAMSDLFAEKNGHTNGHAKPDTIFKAKPAIKPVSKPTAPAERPVVERTYSYTDALGRELYQAVRLKPKSFRQRQRDGEGGWKWTMDGVERVLYRLPEVMRADTVWVVEGEKDADTLAALGLVATTNVGGAGKWLDGYTAALKGKEVVVCGDNDEPGRKHAEKVFESVAAAAKCVRLVSVPAPHKDASDWAVALKPEEARAEFERLAADAVPHYGGVRLPVYSMADLQPAYIKMVQEADAVSLDLSKWLPSMRRLRRLTPGALVAVIGDTGIGKTNILLNVPLNYAHLPTLFFELELTGEELYERAFAHRARVSGLEIEQQHKQGGFPAAAVAAQFPNLYVCPEPGLTVEQVEAIIVKAELKMGVKPVVVLLDYIQLVQGRGERYERVSNTAEALKGIAKRTRTIVFFATQVDRASGKSGQVGLHSGKDSGSIENSATVAITAQRDPDDQTLLTLRVVKATKGGAGTEVRCNIDGETSVITERAPEPYSDQ